MLRHTMNTPSRTESQGLTVQLSAVTEGATPDEADGDSEAQALHDTNGNYDVRASRHPTEFRKMIIFIRVAHRRTGERLRVGEATHSGTG